MNHLFCSLIYKVGPSTDESFGTRGEPAHFISGFIDFEP